MPIRLPFRFLLLICEVGQILYLISTCHWLPDLGSAIIGAVIPYVSVRPLFLPLPNLFLADTFEQGLYPTAIVIFVVLQKSPTFTITRQSASTHFSHPQELSTVEMRIPMSAMYIQGNDRYRDLEMPTSPGPPLVKSKQ